MDDATLSLTAELADSLVDSDAPVMRPNVDPRSVPLRFHNLRAMAQSGAHCYQSFQSGRLESLAMRLGSGTHAMLFGQPVVLWNQPAKKGKGKAPRSGEAWAEFQAANSGAVILNRKEHDRARAIADALLDNTDASRLLFAPGTLHESTIRWVQQGRERQSTPDCRGPSHLVELKTTRCAEPGRFQRDAMFRGYHAQLADQSAAIEASTGSKPSEVYVVAVETVEPYVVQVLQLTPRALEQGERLCRVWFERYMACEAANQWPGYCASVTAFDVPDDEIGLVFPGSDVAIDEPF